MALSFGRVMRAMALGVAISPLYAGLAAATSPGPCPASALRAFLKASGSVMLSGLVVETNKLDTALAAITPRPALICYSRERPWDKPPASVEVVVNSLMKLGLPIRFFTDAQFTMPAPETIDAAL